MNISRSARRHRNRYFLDRNLGSVLLATQLRQAGLDITAHDEIYQQTERDPWVFYDRGRLRFVIVTSDTAFMKSFPHMAAVSLAKATVLAFSNNNYKSNARGEAFLKALPKIEKEIYSHRRSRRNFIAVIGMGGTFRICQEAPLPERRRCDQRDWDSYERVCKEQGVLALAPQH